ncbi:hypothetical protein [Paenibacillus sp. GCM10027626]|uniref:phage lytic cycle repressor MrpR family protein n=1 Tax=Paenibacillus sp. GCM10027626 TaxID=3273411 RepID=UPI0036314ADF
MSNLTYEQGYYNEHHKRLFLSAAGDPASAAAYGRILSRAKIFEEKHGKDLYDFNLREIEDVFRYLDPTSYASAKGAFWIVQNYIRWAIENGLTRSAANPLDPVAGIEYVQKMVSNSKKRFFTEAEMLDSYKDLVNDQDAVIPALIFEGALGKQCAELRNLKMSDVNIGQRLLKLTDYDGSVRELKVSQRLIKLIQGAYTQREYYKKNGNADSDMKSPATSQLLDYGYVLKSVNNGRIKAQQVAQHLILQRLRGIAEYSGFPTYTAINIRNSGILKMMRDIYLEQGDVTVRELEAILQAFHVIKSPSEYMNITNYKNDFLNIEKMKQVYQID